MAGEQKYTIDLAVTGISQLDRLSTNLDLLSKRMNTLRGAVIGLGLGALARSAVMMADEMQDLSNATGIATARLIEFRNALAVSGGDATQMATGITTFARSIDEAAQGSLKAQNTFRELGISLTDLRTLSEQELLTRALDGLSNISDASRRAAIQMDLFGKSFRTVDPAQMAEQLRNTAGAGNAYADSIKRAAELNDTLATAAANVRLAILEAFGPLISMIAGFNNQLNQSKESMETLTTLIKAAGIALSVAFAFTGWALIVRAIGVIGRGVGALTSLFSGLGKTITSTFNANSTVMKILRGVGGLIVGIGTALGLVSATSSETKDAAADAETAGKKIDESLNKINRPIDTTQLDNARAAVRKMGDDFEQANQRIVEQIEFESTLIGKSKEFQDIEKARADLARRTADEIQKLTDAKAKLSKEEREAGLAADYDTQIARIRELGAVEQDRLDAAIRKQNQLNAAEQLRQFSLKSQQDAADQLLKLQREMEDLGISEIEKRYRDITRAADDAAKAAIRAEEARRGGIKLSKEEADAYYAAARANNEALKQQTEELFEKSREFGTGWSRAFAEYADNATNAARQAENLFRRATQGMEDAIVNFAKTGKFEWRNFLASIAEELLRSNIQRLIAQIFSGGSAGGGGNLLGWLFGSRASGGPVTQNRPYMVGENGPEMFVPATSGQILNQSQMPGAGGMNITYNINAVDAVSFQQLVARDPAFIYAVTEQGRLSLPQSRR